jgi:hypothetical protein
MGKLEQAVPQQDVSYAMPEQDGCRMGFAEHGGPFERHQRARNAAEACWQRGRWSDALLLYMEAESHLLEAEPLSGRRAGGGSRY